MDAEKQKQIDENLDRVIQFRDTLNPETDRGCALIAASFLYVELSRMLRKGLIQDSKKVLDGFFEGDGPLARFSSRINAAYLFGKIDKTVYLDLHLVRKIRNLFAHQPDPITFQFQEIAELCDQFKWTSHSPKTNPRRVFNNVVCQLLAHIHGAELNSTPPNPIVWNLPEEAKAYLHQIAPKVAKELLSKNVLKK
jgi:hypothetical protein